MAVALLLRIAAAIAALFDRAPLVASKCRHHLKHQAPGRIRIVRHVAMTIQDQTHALLFELVNRVKAKPRIATESIDVAADDDIAWLQPESRDSRPREKVCGAADACVDQPDDIGGQVVGHRNARDLPLLGLQARAVGLLVCADAGVSVYHAAAPFLEIFIRCEASPPQSTLSSHLSK